MSNEELIYWLRCNAPVRKDHPLHRAADTLEAADKRIAELEANRDSLVLAIADHVTVRVDYYKKLAVAREALKGAISWSALRTGENIIHKPDLAGECVQIRLTGLKMCAEALAQIGEK